MVTSGVESVTYRDIEVNIARAPIDMRQAGAKQRDGDASATCRWATIM
jgi:hypothetical protein